MYPIYDAVQFKYAAKSRPDNAWKSQALENEPQFIFNIHTLLKTYNGNGKD